ncbi:MAG: TRAP transporter large permease [Lautropia sp.]
MIIGAIGMLAVLAMAALGMPISFSLFFVGFAGVFALQGFNVASSVMSLTPVGYLLGSEFAALPLFILLGSFAVASGIASMGFEAARAWLGRLPGGLGIATIASSAAFAACSGSSFAAAATMGKMAIPEMRQSGYSDRLATGTCAAGGLLATVIPPSGAMVIYGIASGESIGKLLIAGVVPGIVITLFFMAGIYGYARLNPAAAPLIDIRSTWRERLAYVPKLWGIATIFVVVFFGLFFGWFTATESAAFGALTSLAILLLRQGRRSLSAVIEACVECASLTATILFLILGAFVFNSFVVMAGLPKALTGFIVGLGVEPTLVIVVMMGFYVILGMFLEGAAMMLITIPIFYPVVVELGFSGIWFGVLVVMMLEIGMLTPPFGMVAFVIRSVAPSVPLADIFKGALLFAGLEGLVVALVIAFPAIALWLPSLM